MGKKNRSRPSAISTREQENVESSDVMSEDSISENSGENENMTNENEETVDEDIQPDVAADVVVDTVVDVKSVTEEKTIDSIIEDVVAPIVEDPVTCIVEDKVIVSDAVVADVVVTPATVIPEIATQEKAVQINNTPELIAQKDVPVVELAQLDLNDSINASVKNVPGKSGNGNFTVKELLKFQFTAHEAHIIITSQTLKLPFLKLLKTVESIDKLPVIHPGIRSDAVKRFAVANNLHIANN